MGEKIIILKLATCGVCGAEFSLRREDHYIVRDEGTTGLALVVGGPEETLYDAFDCPLCGCQNVMQERKRQYKSTKEVLGDD